MNSDEKYLQCNLKSDFNISIPPSTHLQNHSFRKIKTISSYAEDGTSAPAASNHLQYSWMQQNQVIDKLYHLTVSSGIVSTHVYPGDYRHPAAETIGLCGHVCV